MGVWILCTRFVSRLCSCVVSLGFVSVSLFANVDSVSLIGSSVLMMCALLVLSVLCIFVCVYMALNSLVLVLIIVHGLRCSTFFGNGCEV